MLIVKSWLGTTQFQALALSKAEEQIVPIFTQHGEFVYGS
jgi:hypothetical protein